MFGNKKTLVAASDRPCLFAGRFINSFIQRQQQQQGLYKTLIRVRSWRARACTEVLARMRCLQSDESTHSHLQGNHLSRAGLVILQEGKRWRGRRPFCAITASHRRHCGGRRESKDGEPLPMGETAFEYVSTLVQVSLVVSTEPIRTDW